MSVPNALKSDGGPAFPIPECGGCEAWGGMSLRDYFAAKAMQGLLAKCADPETGQQDDKDLVEWSVEFADALIAALNAEGGE